MEQMKMFLTRMGKGSKLVITGDESQSDLPLRFRGAFQTCLDKLQDIDGLGIVTLENQDIVRNSIIPKILEKLGE